MRVAFGLSGPLKASLHAKVVDHHVAIEILDADTEVDLYEYMLSKIATASTTAVNDGLDVEAG